jgi:hypothetical protein
MTASLSTSTDSLSLSLSTDPMTASLSTSTSTAIEYVAGAQLRAAITDTVYLIPKAPITGAELISHAARYPMEFATKSDLVAASGHVKENGKLSFVGFYEALLAAKTEADPNFYVTIQDATDEDKEYDQLSHSLQQLYDLVHEEFGHAWDHAMILEFMGELDDLGITASNFSDAFYSAIPEPSYHWEREFAEEYVTSIEYGLENSMAYAAIDWQDVWDHNLTYEFNSIDFDGSVFIFNNNI